MKRLREIFSLTKAEQSVIVTLLLLLLGFAIFQKERERVAPSRPKELESPARTLMGAAVD